MGRGWADSPWSFVRCLCGGGIVGGGGRVGTAVVEDEVL